MDAAAEQVAAEAKLPMEPMAELLVVDRRTWVAGNVRTLRELFGEATIPGADTRLVAWEAGLFLGLLSRAVLAQYDPFRDLLIVVHPNLGEVAHGDALRWLIFHELTHLAQFRRAPWMRDYIVERGRSVIGQEDTSWVRDAARKMAADLPELVDWARRALRGESGEQTPLMDMLPEEQRHTIMELHSLLTVLEGHATHVTDVVGRKLIPEYDRMQERIKASRKRPPVVRLLEAVAGIEMKRQQYIIGRAFCDAVWEAGGADALAPVWTGPEAVPDADEIRSPGDWLERVGTATRQSTGSGD